jgi:ferredoxin
MEAKINENQCTGCGICENICPEGIEMVDGIAKIKNQNTDCLKDAANSCPRKCIILEGNESEESNNTSNNNFNQGQGRGMEQGQGRGMGQGLRDGSGMGRGGDGRGQGGGKGQGRRF